MLNNDKVRDIDAVRLVMLYSLRYEKNSNNDIAGLIDMLKKRNTSDKLFKVRFKFSKVSLCIFSKNVQNMLLNL